MTHLKDFTASIERASKSEPIMQKWLYGTRELERRLLERLVYLCRYLDMIPESALASYADVMIDGAGKRRGARNVVAKAGLIATRASMKAQAVSKIMAAKLSKQ